MCLDHCERLLSRHPGSIGGTGANINDNPDGDGDESLVYNPTLVNFPEMQTHHEIVDDMMSIAGAFGTVDGFPFDMTGMWDVSGFQGVDLT
jgi:hypothetical protein